MDLVPELNFIFLCAFLCMWGVGRSKDSGAYDLGELDQALFLYFDGQQDPSSVQDQRRKLHLSLSLSILFVFVAILLRFLIWEKGWS